MIYQIDKIVKDVRICMDQNGVADSLLATGDEETLMLDDIIRSKVLEAVERVHLMAPYYLLELGHNFCDVDPDDPDDDEDLYWEDGDTCGWVMLPSDFLRLVVFEMSDWERPVYAAISTLDPLYAKQRGRVKGLRGTAQKPVCAIGMRPEGRVLEFYSCKSREATVAKAVYIPYPKEEDGGVDISERCYDAVVHTIASLTLTSCGEVERASAYASMANEYLNNEYR